MQLSSQHCHEKHDFPLRVSQHLDCIALLASGPARVAGRLVVADAGAAH